MPTTLHAANAGDGSQRMAVLAESLYLANLLLIPGFAFAALLWLQFRSQGGRDPLARCHLRQAVSASLWAAVLLVGVNLVLVGLADYRDPSVWAMALVYTITCHAALVLLGVVGLAKAMAGRIYVYPVVGRPC